jgi:hypothetical protein
MKYDFPNGNSYIYSTYIIIFLFFEINFVMLPRIINGGYCKLWVNGTIDQRVLLLNMGMEIYYV